MKRNVVCVSFAAWILLVGWPMAWGQSTAQISGTVRDQSGAVLPGVEVTAIQSETGVRRSMVTNETGSYVLPDLPVGPYRLEAGLPGFRTFVQTGIVLQVNAKPEINPVLEVGQVSEQVEVQANAALVETRSSGVGQVIENERVLELPLNGRNVVELITLSGASTPAPAANVSGNGRDIFNGASQGTASINSFVSIAGGMASGVTYLLDGALHNNPINSSALPVPFPDALQEFKVETSATGAQSGEHAGGSVSLVTKSGTNQFHGDLFEFVRNGVFNARNVFAIRHDTLKRNQFGGTVGGPIVQNKMFFFAGFQATAVRQDPADIQGFVPTEAMLAGDFTTFASPQCNGGRTITLKAPFINNRIDPSAFSKAALAYVAKLPSSVDPCGKVLYGNPQHTNQQMTIGKADYQRTAAHSMFIRYIADHLDDTPPYDINHNVFSLSTGGGFGLNQSFTIGDTYLIGTKMVNSLRVSGNRLSQLKSIGTYFNLADLGVKMYNYSSSSFPTTAKVSVTGGPAAPTSTGPTKTAMWMVSDDISLLAGNHQIAFGAAAARYDTNWYSCFYCGGYVMFNGQVTGLGYADLLTGTAFSFQQAPVETHTGYQWYLAPYITDTWKAARTLTLNFGLRYEPYFPQIWTDGSAYHLDLDALKKGVRTTVYKNAPPGLTYTGDPGYPGRAVMTYQWAHFSPRVGLAWSPGDGKTSIRAGFGTFYDIIPNGIHNASNIAPPLVPRILVNNARLDDPWATYPGGNPFPTSRGPDAPFPLYSTYAIMKFNTKNPLSSQWNLSIQRQIGSNWLVSGSYLGSNTAHFWTVKSENPALFLGLDPCTLNNVRYAVCSTTANTDQRRPLMLANPQVGQYFSFVNSIDDGGTSNYNGLLLSVQRRVSRGMTLSTNYTWSHCISDQFQNSLNGGTGGSTYTDPNNRRADRGNCTTSAIDRRHVFNLTAVVESPEFSNAKLRGVAGNWRLSPLLRISSGQFLTATTSSDIALSGISNQRLSQALPSLYGDGSIGHYLNSAAFAVPAAGTLGNLGPGTILGPATWQFDAALSRAFQFKETRRIELRAEAFNLTNSFRKGNPTTNINSNIFGQINSALDPRIMQFALKYVF